MVIQKYECMPLSSSSSSECSAQVQIFHCKPRPQGCSSAKGRSSTTNSGTKVAVSLGMNRCSSFLLLSAPHSLFSIRTDLERSEKIPGTPAWSWGKWIWLTGPSGLHRNSPQGLNVSSIRIFDQIRNPNNHSPPHTSIWRNNYRVCRSWGQKRRHKEINPVMDRHLSLIA